MEDQGTASSVPEIVAVEPVIRRVIAARAANPADIDDLVQDCLERLLTAHRRLAPEAVLPFAVVTARNLASTHAKRAMRRAAATPRIHEATEPERPEDAVLAGEARRAMTAALARLSPQERGDILTYYDVGLAAGDAGSGPAVRGGHADLAVRGGAAESPGALRVRMSRTRAKLRLEYLLAFRRLELPSPVCRRVLLAISGGDMRRQRELNAGQHLLDCETCAALSEPLGRRSVALTAISLPGALAAWAAARARTHPAQTAGVAAGAAAVAAAAVLVPQAFATRPAPAVHAHISSSPSGRAPAQVITNLLIDGRPVPNASARQSIRSMIGEPAAGSSVAVDTAVTRNGFWIGSARGRIWVELVGPLKPLRIQAHDRVRFTGTVVGNPPSFPARIGVTSPRDAGLLARQGAHLAVSTTKISVVTRP